MPINKRSTKTRQFSSKPKHEESHKYIEIVNNEDVKNIKPKGQIKILGFLTNTRGKNDAQAGKVIAEMSNVINSAYKCRNYLSQMQRNV